MAWKSDELLVRIKDDAIGDIPALVPSKTLVPDWQDKTKQQLHDEIMTVMQEGYERSPEANFDVVKGLGDDSLRLMNKQMGAGTMMAPTLTKDIANTSPLTSSNVAFQGFTPVDLRRPARLLYPVYSPIRNRLPRVKGEGMAYNLKRVLTISNSGIFGAKNLDISAAEIPSGQTFANYPMTGDYNPVVLTADQPQVPYKSFRLDQSASWFSNFASMGYEDVVGLTTLTLLQSMMMGDEVQILSGQTAVLGTPSTTFTKTARTALGTEAGLSAGTLWATVTAVNMLGETTAPTAVNCGTVTAGQVVDLTLGTDITGAHGYNVYAALGGASAPTTLYFQGFTAWNHYTVGQNTLKVAGGTAPASDTGTGKSTRYDGLISILAGNANSTYDPTSLGVNTGYTYRHNGLNGGTPVAFGLADLSKAFLGLWNTSKANPDEIWMTGSDRLNLSNAALAAGAGFQGLRIETDTAGAQALTAGVVVSQVYNPVTGKAVKLTVHPYLTQGNAIIMSYQLPMSYSEVPNVAQFVALQDYLSVAWPVVDARYKFSILEYGAFVMEAPQFCGLIQGIPNSATQPYS